MGTRPAAKLDEAAALDAFVKLIRAAESLGSRVHEHLAEDDLTVSQFGVLDCLQNFGPMCQRDIGKKLLKSGGNITLVIDNLEKRGLVVRERSSQNRKFVMVHLTEAGRRLGKRVFPRHVAAVLREFAVLSPAELADLARLCRAVGRGEAAKEG